MADPSFALTYPQLVAQCIDRGFDNASLGRVQDTCEFMERMADGIYRAQGVPFSCHLVRTASIVLSTGASLQVVQAALVHSAYRLSRFRNSRRRPFRAAHRRELQAALGTDVEALVYAYEKLSWYRAEALDRYISTLESMSDTTREALLIRLADELEDWLDLALAFKDNRQVACRIDAYGERCIRLAELMALGELADFMRSAAARYRDLQLPGEVILHRNRVYERPRRHLWERSTPETWLLAGARCIARSLRKHPA
jgi:hypothetical protein